MNLFVNGEFTANSGRTLDFKIERDALTADDIETLAVMIAKRFDFDLVVGVPRGGDRLCSALKRYENIDNENLLIVDDVLTTGASMENLKQRALRHKGKILGVVVFARGPCPDWITPIFSLHADFAKPPTCDFSHRRCRLNALI